MGGTSSTGECLVDLVERLGVEPRLLPLFGFFTIFGKAPSWLLGFQDKMLSSYT